MRSALTRRLHTAAGASALAAFTLLPTACTTDLTTPQSSPEPTAYVHGPPVPGDPVPIAGGIDVPPLIHVFLPGVPGFHDVDAEPNVITNFRGFVALAYVFGTATDRNGNTYDMSNDIRVYQGEYVAADGRHFRGTFGFIWIDLFEPGTGFTVQVHDFNGGIAPSGLFWAVRIPDGALQRIPGGRVRLHLEDLEILESFTFLGPTEIPATVSYDVTWKPDGPVRHIRPQSSDPTDPHNWAGEVRNAVATGTFSGFEEGFSFKGAGTSADAFAEMGSERNGVFVR